VPGEGCSQLSNRFDYNPIMSETIRVCAAFVVGAIMVVITPLVPSTALAQTTGLPTYTATEAAKHIGELATIADKVVAVYQSRDGEIFPDMGGKYPNQTFSTVIPPKRAWSFSDYHKYDGKMVAVFGKITLYRGKPLTIVTTRTQFVSR
jgi:hypothetical protein